MFVNSVNSTRIRRIVHFLCHFQVRLVSHEAHSIFTVCLEFLNSNTIVNVNVATSSTSNSNNNDLVRHSV